MVTLALVDNRCKDCSQHMTTKQPNAAIYCRISRDAEQRGLGVARQLRECQAKAGQKNWNVVGEFTDNDVSGSRKKGRTKTRPEFERLLEAIRTGEVDAVIAAEQSRLFRDPMEFEQFLITCELVGMHRLITYNGELDIESGEGILYARIRAAVDAEETRKMGERIRRKHVEIAEQGRLSGGGRRPFGYESDRITVRRDEAREVQWAARRILAGASLRSIAMEWNDRQVKTVTGALWSTTTVKRLLISARISGQRSLKDVIVADAVWPGIIKPKTREALLLAFKAPRRAHHEAPGVATPRTYLYSGLVYCGICGNRMDARPLRVRGYHYRRFWCSADRGGCNRCGVSSDPLDEFVNEMILSTFSLADLTDKPSAGAPLLDEYDDLVIDLRADEAKMEELSRDYYVDRALPRNAFFAAKGPIEERITVTQDRLSRLRGVKPLATVPGKGKTLRDRWPNLTFEEQRRIIEEVVDRITIAPTTRGSKPGRNRFQYDRLDVKFKV